MSAVPAHASSEGLAWATAQRVSLARAVGIGAALFAAVQCVELAFRWLHAKALVDLCQWDCRWYASILVHGYQSEAAGHVRGDAANWAFFPLFPMCAKAVSAGLGVEPRLAMILTAKACFLLAIVAFVGLAAQRRPSASPWTAGAVVAFNPYFVYGNAGYSEPLFLALTCASFHALFARRYVLAGLLGGLSTATRVVAGAFGFAFVIHVLRRRREPHEWSRVLLGLALVPAGLAAFMLFLHLRVGDALAFSHVQIAWNHAPGNPLERISAMLGGEPAQTLAAVALLVAAAAIAALVRAGEHEMAGYSVVATLLPVSVDYVSLPRYVWWQAPVLYALLVGLDRVRGWTPVYVAAGIGFGWLVYAGWFEGAVWTI